MYATRAQAPAVVADQDRAADLDLVAAFFDGFARERDLTATLNVALEGMVGALGAQIAEVFLWDRERNAFDFVSSRGRSVPFGRQTRPDDPLLARCLSRAATVCGGGHTACAPLSPGGEPYGVVRVARDAEDLAFERRDLALLSAMAKATTLAVGSARLQARVEEQTDTAQDLALAAEIQRNLLPRVEPGRHPVFGLNRPIRQVSGDFFDFFALADGRVAFALGDVAGKGINAALLMAKVASLYRCLGKTIDRPDELLQRLNDETLDTASRGLFVTMVAGVYDATKGRVAFANAGHEPPLLRSPDHRYETFAADAPPLGILPDLCLSTREVDLGGGEFFIFSDGLTEFRYAGGEQLGIKGLIQMIEALSSLPLAERMDKLLNELDQEGWSLRDDLTVLAIDDAWVKRDD